MTIINETETTLTRQKNTFNGSTRPVFMPKTMEQPMATDATTQDTVEPILSLLDVKEVYDLAYAEKAKGPGNLEAFKTLLAEAVKLDLTYRRQLAKLSSYKDRTKMKNFNNATNSQTDSSQVA